MSTGVEAGALFSAGGLLAGASALLPQAARLNMREPARSRAVSFFNFITVPPFITSDKKHTERMSSAGNFIVKSAGKKDQGTNLRFFEIFCDICGIVMKAAGAVWYN